MIGRGLASGGALRSLRHRNFRLFFTGQLVSAIGNWLTTIAATLFVLLGTAGQPVYAFHRLFVADLMSHVLKLAAYGTVSLMLVYSRQYLLDRGLLRGEFISLLLFAWRGLVANEHWYDGALKISFWGFNCGLFLMMMMKYFGGMM